MGQELKQELSDLVNTLRDHQTKVRDDPVIADTSVKPGKIVSKKLLKGHIGKVTCCHFSGDSRHCVSGSLDGKLIVWDTWTGNKIQVIPLRSAWVMTAVFAGSGNMVCCGGMDNMLTIYDLNNRDSNGVAKMIREISGYEGFLSSARFLDDEDVVTGSGDMKVMQYKIESGQKVLDLQGHNGDVASLSLNPSAKEVFVTGSVDKTARLWDLRVPGCVQTFWGHESDINSVFFHPASTGFLSCSEDKTVRLWDLRSDQEVTSYKCPTPNSSFTSVGVSLSGRIVFGSSDDSSIHMWDISGNHLGNLSGHDNRITQLSVAPSGFALATASWDSNLRVWGL